MSQMGHYGTYGTLALFLFKHFLLFPHSNMAVHGYFLAFSLFNVGTLKSVSFRSTVLTSCARGLLLGVDLLTYSVALRVHYKLDVLQLNL